METYQEGPCFTVGVFQDAAWASRGLTALAGDGFPQEALSILAKQAPDVIELVRETFGVGAEQGLVEVPGLGPAVAHGALVETLQGADNALGASGMAATMRRAGFQAHDGFIYETLTARGGVLVAVAGEPRAADALALMHAYGGGNAAIGAWGGRV